MIFTETDIKGVFLIDIVRMRDDRGFFGRSWCKDELQAHGLNAEILQSSISYNRKKGTLRGMHYQNPPYGECKMIQCTSGAIFDVIVDLRPESETYMKWISIELTGNNFRFVYLPERMAHGFITLKNNSVVHYSMTAVYTPFAEAGFRFDDPAFRISWPMEPVVISEKDLHHPPFVPVVSSTLKQAYL